MNVVADTCIWCDFFQKGDAGLSRLLENQLLVIHPQVIGELAVGNLPNRTQTLHDLQRLPVVRPASSRETLSFIESSQLYGRGLQWNDLQILAAVVATPGIILWTRDQKLQRAAQDRGVAFIPKAE